MGFVERVRACSVRAGAERDEAVARMELAS